MTKMKKDGLNDAAIAAFKHNYEQLVGGADGMVPEDTIEAVQVTSRPLSFYSCFHMMETRMPCVRGGCARVLSQSVNYRCIRQSSRSEHHGRRLRHEWTCLSVASRYEYDDAAQGTRVPVDRGSSILSLSRVHNSYVSVKSIVRMKRMQRDAAKRLKHTQGRAGCYSS